MESKNNTIQYQKILNGKVFVSYASAADILNTERAFFYIQSASKK
jgi:hypothetical protein